MGGAVSFDAIDDFCSAINVSSNEKAVFVNFSNTSHPKGFAMVVRDGTHNCGTKYREVVVFGKDKNGVPINRGVGSQSLTGKFSNNLVHELGHVVGLGHSHDVNECRSVMAYSTSDECYNSPYTTWGGRFPHRWDKVCSRSYSHRSLRSNLLGFNSSGVLTSSTSSNDTHEQAAIHSGVARTSSYGYNYAALFKVKLSNSIPPVNQPAVETSYLGTDGNFYLSSNIPSSSHYDITSLFGVPVVHTFESISSDGTRVSFIDEVNDANGTTQYNPPFIQSIRTNPTMYSSPNYYDISYKYCGTGCTNTYSMRSHYPIVATTDPITGNEIVVQLLTNSLGGNDGSGLIKVHAGFHLGTSTFEQGELLPTGNLPSSSSAWSYNRRTDVPPSVACADSTWGSQYNCLIAWLDKDRLTGRILYSYFKVNSAGSDVIWDPNGIKIRGGTQTFTSPAVGYFGGKFHLSWRSFYDNLYTYSSASPFSWNWIDTEIPSERLFGAPSFIHNSGKEAALVYNTIP